MAGHRAWLVGLLRVKHLELPRSRRRQRRLEAALSSALWALRSVVFSHPCRHCEWELRAVERGAAAVGVVNASAVELFPCGDRAGHDAGR